MNQLPIETGTRYLCRRADQEDIDWSRYPEVLLSDTVTGSAPRQRTAVQACWAPGWLFVRFVCEDDHIVSTMTQRDDPLYLEDVVEVFVDPEGAGLRYAEFEFSPRNVQFDAWITNDGEGRIDVDVSWDADGLRSSVMRDSENRLVYELALPLGGWAPSIRPGEGWRVNLYRIDYSPDGTRELQAWSPTGKPNFHLPCAFGQFEFAD
ncbi:hypothetical protein J31TS4_08630 [Paenibacillus sp. J31TS4]|uniref:carbohydrate-binding family 9-like protein n=1 Tax=Paenibacillus sp. J31TS4 TaxID=2807195 RepID=UPI001B19B32E|nr:carbohydrate-binding family 9-like protein [Paenibacillus sp. J31TS4]GIP37583.1 hypothetical protein J31TS4_08630 [Paenibacillus sp. J31TS4]